MAGKVPEAGRYGVYKEGEPMIDRKELLDATRKILEYIKWDDSDPAAFQAIIPAELVKDALEAGEGPSPADLMTLWNAKKHDRLPICRVMTLTRRRHAAARLREFPNYRDWAAFLDAVNKNDWALGLKSSADYPNWRANFDWFIRPGSILRFLEQGLWQVEGKVDNREQYGAELDRRE